MYVQVRSKWCDPRKLESLARHLANEPSPDGIGVDLVTACFSAFEEILATRMALGHDVNSSDVVRRAQMALLRRLFPMIAGAVLGVDAGILAGQ